MSERARYWFRLLVMTSSLYSCYRFAVRWQGGGYRYKSNSERENDVIGERKGVRREIVLQAAWALERGEVGVGEI